MSTDVNLLGKALKQLGFLILLFIVSPITLIMGFKALKRFTETPKIFLAYIILGIGFLLIFFTIFFAFKTFKNLLNAFFNHSNK